MLQKNVTLFRLATAVAANMSRRPFHLTSRVAGGGHDMPHETLNDGPAIAAGREYVGFFFEW
jgi:hypothetical protein